MQKSIANLHKVGYFSNNAFSPSFVQDIKVLSRINYAWSIPYYSRFTQLNLQYNIKSKPCAKIPSARFFIQNAYYWSTRNHAINRGLNIAGDFHGLNVEFPRYICPTDELLKHLLGNHLCMCSLTFDLSYLWKLGILKDGYYLGFHNHIWALWWKFFDWFVSDRSINSENTI